MAARSRAPPPELGGHVVNGHQMGLARHGRVARAVDRRAKPARDLLGWQGGEDVAIQPPQPERRRQDGPAGRHLTEGPQPLQRAGPVGQQALQHCADAELREVDQVPRRVGLSAGRRITGGSGPATTARHDHGGRDGRGGNGDCHEGAARTHGVTLSARRDRSGKRAPAVVRGSPNPPRPRADTPCAADWSSLARRL